MVATLYDAPLRLAKHYGAEILDLCNDYSSANDNEQSAAALALLGS